MKPNTSFGLAVLMVAVLALAVPQLAQAAGTDFGTTVTNSATIQYTAGSSPITTNASVDFLVDRVLDWTIAPSTAATVFVFPASTGNAIAYSVENDTNGTVDILLTLTQLGADAPSTVVLYADDGNTAGTFDTGDNPLLAGGGGFYMDEVGEDTAPTVFIVVDVAAGAGTSETYTYEIASVTRAGNGASVLGTVLSDDSASADISTQVQNVYNDGAGYNDAAGDLNYTAYAAFGVVNAALTATKSATVINDPVNGTTNPKAIPLAQVRYVIQISNTGTADATGVTVVDSIPAETTYVPGSLYISGVVDPDDTAAPGDYNVTNAGAVTAPLAAPLLGGNSTTVGFTVQIQ